MNLQNSDDMPFEVKPYTGRGISALHDDILSEVFSWNANIYLTERCLQTTRRSSQVCQTWRSFLLGSKLLWGRLLDLGELGQKTNKWRAEVLRRSGDSPLWIHGTVSGTSSGTRPGTIFFFSVLEAHLARVQHLRLEVIEPMDQDAWGRALDRPAPNLRSCALIPSNFNHALVFSESIVPPFDDQGPWLRNYTNTCLFVGLEGSWIWRLRTLDICSPLSSFEILHALEYAHQLENLGISGLRTLHYSDTRHPFLLPFISLPSLTQFRLTHARIPFCADFLIHICSAQNCTLSIMAQVGDNVGSMKTDFNLASKVLSPYVQRFLQSQTVTDIQIDLTPHAFWFLDVKRVNGRSLLFRIVITSLLEFPPDAYDFFPILLAKRDFSSITKLSLNLPLLLPTSAIAYFPFFMSFSSLANLVVNEHTLRMVLDMPTPPGKPVFPVLQTLTIGSFEESSANTTGEGATILFLRWRKEIGLPLQKLDLGLTEWEDARKMMFLRDMMGVQVVWRDEAQESH